MSIFPFLDAPETTNKASNELPLFKEYSWDFEENVLLLKDGKPIILEKNEALRVWAYKTLKTERYRFLAYTWNHGHEFENLMGSTYSSKACESEAKRYLEECLLVNQYIKEIRNVKTSPSKDILNIDFVMLTIYGEVKMSV